MTPDPIDSLLEGPTFAPRPGAPPSAPAPREPFLPAVDHCPALWRGRSPPYADSLRSRGLGGGPLAALPALFLPVLKGSQFPLLPDLPIVARLTSSGTT